MPSVRKKLKNLLFKQQKGRLSFEEMDYILLHIGEHPDLMKRAPVIAPIEKETRLIKEEIRFDDGEIGYFGYLTEVEPSPE